MKQVLILEDDVEILDLLKQKCEEYQCHVDCAKTKEDFIMLLNKNKYDFLLCDYCINETNLINVLQSYSGCKNKLNIILMTGLVLDNNDFNNLKEYNLIDCIDKPFNLNNIICLLEKHKLL